MSIIYEALKKVEKSQTTTTPKVAEVENKNKTPPEKTKPYFIYILIILFCVFIANTFFSLISKKALFVKTLSSITKATVPQAIVAPQVAQIEKAGAPVTPVTTQPTPTPAQLVLNGIFFSKNDGYVLINNKILKEGDAIDGAIVKKITLDGVELDAGGNMIKLSNTK